MRDDYVDRMIIKPVAAKPSTFTFVVQTAPEGSLIILEVSSSTDVLSQYGMTLKMAEALRDNLDNAIATFIEDTE